MEGRPDSCSHVLVHWGVLTLSILCTLYFICCTLDRGQLDGFTHFVALEGIGNVLDAI